MATQRLLQFLSRSVSAAVFLFAFVGAQNVFAQTIYVSSTTGADAFDGASATIAGGSGPKATLAGALSVASAGDTISIEAGTYAENFDFGAGAPSVSVTVTASGGVTAATFTGTSTMSPGAADTITLSSGSVVVQGASFTLTDGSFVNSGTMSFTGAALALGVTAGSMSGNTPSYTGAVTATYSLVTAGSAGSELPASLNVGGSITVAGAVNTTFGSALTIPAGVAGNAVSVTNTATTTFAAVTVGGAENVNHSGNDVTFASLTMGNGGVTTTGAAGQTLTVTGDLSFSQSVGNAGASVTNGALATMTLGSLTLNTTIAGAGNAASDVLAATVANSGTLTVQGAVADNSATDADETDSSQWSISNVGGAASATFSGAFDIADAITGNPAGSSVIFGSTANVDGDVTTAGAVTFGGNSTFGGVVTNTGIAAPNVMALGSYTLTLTSAAGGHALGAVTGGSSTVAVTGDAAVASGALSGNLNQTGDGGITGAVTVGGNLTMAGLGAMSGSIDVAGNGTFSGSTAFTAGAGTNDIDGSATISGTVSLAAAGGGDLVIGSGSVTAAGSLTINNGATLTVNGNFDTSAGGTFVADAVPDSPADDAALVFTLPQSSSATYTPGPNTRVDDLSVNLAAGATAATLNLGQSIFVDENFTTAAGTTVNMGNYAIRMDGNTSAAAIGGGMTTPAGQSGALTFEGTTTTLSGLGDISNILINVATGNRMSVLAGTSVDFTGELTLFTGGITVAAGSDISPEGSTAEVRRNSAAGAVTTDIIGLGTFNNDGNTYILSIFGGAAVAALNEYAATGITALNIEDTGTNYTTDKNATVGNITVEAGATLSNGVGFDITATGVVNNSGTITGGAGDQLILTGDSQAHTSTGNVVADINVMADGVTWTGSATLVAATQAASITNLFVGDGAAGTGNESITMTNVQQVDGTITVASDGTLTIGLVQDDGVAGTGNGDEGSVDGVITVADGGSMTWTSNATADADITVGLAAGTASTFDFNGNTVFMGTVGTTFSADSDANLGTSGELEADAAININTNSDNAVAPTSALPGLDVDDVVDLEGSVRVVGTTDIDAAVVTDGVAARSLTLSGTVHINDAIGAAGGALNLVNVTIIGTDVMVQGARTLTGALTINATNVNFTGDALAGADALTVTGLFTQTAGNVDLNGVDLILQGGADYTAGTYTAQASTDEVVFNTVGAVTTNGGTWTIPNAVVDVVLTIDGAGVATDVLTISNRLELSANLIAGGAGAANFGVINLGDGSATFYLDADGGNVVVGGADGTINYGADTWTVEYNGTANTGAELPNAIDTMLINAATQLADAKNVTVNTLDVNAGGLDIDNAATVAAEGVTINDGGAFIAAIDAPIQGAQAPAVASTTNYTLTLDGTNTTTDNLVWPAANRPNFTVSPALAGVVQLHASRTASSVTVASGDILVAGIDGVDLAGNGDYDDVGDVAPSSSTLTVTGALNTSGVPTAIRSALDPAGISPQSGTIAFAGTAAQTITGGLWFDGGVNINNTAGVTLSGGNLNLTDNNTNALCNLPAGTSRITLTAGVLTTGTNRVILCHQNTTNQGFTRNGTTQTGVVFGNVQAVVDGTASPNTTDRVEFPLGDADGNYKPYAMTFNTPNQLAADPVLIASYVASSPEGTNGLPIATTDLQSNSFNVGRYPEFHWSVTSAPTVTPSVDYDVEFRAAGYANFADEDIERTRAIRRADGSENNFWILAAPNAADNDNFAASATEPVAVARNASGSINSDGILFTFGLETNLSATDPAALTLNAGNSEVVDLTTVFDGGGANYTYTVTGADAAVVTTAVAGDNLTVTGAGAGSDTFTVTIDDGFQSVDATVSVTVNEALVAVGGLEDVTVAGGSADADVDASGDFSGGTAPYTYTVATSDPAVVTVVVSAGGVVTHTFVGAGTATVTVTQTDSEGDSVDSSFDVTVNGGLVAAGGLVAVTLEEGNVDVTDVDGEFSGGNGAATFTYTASSSDTDVATVAVSGSDVSVTGVSPYVVASGAVTGDAGPATITITATDDLGAATTSTFTVTVTPKLGNVDGSGGPSPASASAVLNNFLSLPGSALTANQATAADFNLDAAITPFDAALIFDAFFNGKVEIAANPNVEVAYGELFREDNIITIPVQMTGDLNDVVSGHFSTQIDPAFATIVGVTPELGDGWLINHTVSEDGAVLLAFAGVGDIESSGTIANIAIELTGSDVQFNLGGEGAANNNATMSIDAVEVAELPETFALHGNYPNPFNPTTSINFDLPESADVEIHVIDMIGRQVMTLPATTIAAGANRTVQVNASQLASGPYFYRVIAKMESKTLVETGRMMLVK